MNGKMKECMQPHVLMHGLFGLGLGFLLADLAFELASAVLGVVIMVVAVVLDVIRKSPAKPSV